MKTSPFLALLSFLFVCQSAPLSAEITIEEQDGEWEVRIDGETFTRYRHLGLNTPSLYPVYGPGQIRMTRKFPLEDAAQGEAKDHVHHVSIWYNHGDVNGIDFWHPQSKNGGKILLDKLIKKENGDSQAILVTANNWSTIKDDTPICADERAFRFGLLEDGSRYIDYEITIKATHGDVVFGDTKEGTMAIRTHPHLRLEGEVAAGKAVNSEGARDGDLWGKAARWVHYWGPVDGKDVGLAIFDHPSNPRHPTTWHAREYGLIAANPFGYSHFFKDEGKRGEMTIKNGDSVTFKYRFVFHEGDPESAEIPEKYEAYTAKNED